MFSPIIRSQEDNIASATNKMIEKKVAENAIIIIPIIISNTTPRVHFQNGNNVKSKCDIDELPEGCFTKTI